MTVKKRVRRGGVGRKRRTERKPVQLWLDPSEYVTIQTAAKAERRSMTQFVRVQAMIGAKKTLQVLKLEESRKEGE